LNSELNAFLAIFLPLEPIVIFYTTVSVLGSTT
jgi:hypothetical protein